MDNIKFLVDMGFPESRANAAIKCSNGDLQLAMDILLAETDPLPAPSPKPGPSGESSQTKHTEGENESVAAEAEASDGTTVGGNSAAVEGGNSALVAKSIKCDECQKLFATPAEVEFHASKSGHSSFSESTDEKKPLSEEEKKQKLKDLEEKMKQRRAQREDDERKDDVDKERKRIQMSKDISEIRRKTEEEEVRRMVEQKKKEKREDKLARERVKLEIERDREARKLKFAVKPETPTVRVQQPAVATSNKVYDNAKLQIRFPSGAAPLIHEFNSKEPLANVRLWIRLNRQDGLPDDSPFNLATTYPRKIFTEEDMEKPLSILGLVPTAVLILTGK